MSRPKTILLQQWSSLSAPVRISSRLPSRTSSVSPLPSTINANVKSTRPFYTCTCLNEGINLGICIRTTYCHHEQHYLHYNRFRGLSKTRSTRQFAIAARKFGKSGRDNLHVCLSQSDQTSSTESNSSDGGQSRINTAGGEESQQSDKSDSSAIVPPEYTFDSGGLGDLSLLQTRRFWLGTSVAIAVVLGGNFVGVTSSILNTNPETSRSIRADLLFPVKGFKRCFETTHGFEFVYPASWVGDQRLLYRAAERAERERFLELPPVAGQRSAPRRTSSASNDPIVAFGPPGTDGEQNVSVIVAPVKPTFQLQRIGGPRQAGELILQQFIAPEGSKKVATLLNAEQLAEDDQLYYTLEYTVKGAAFFRHNLAVYASKDGALYSLNAQTAETAWTDVRKEFSEIVKSFRLLA